MSTRLRWPVLTAVAVLGAAILGLAASWVDWSVTAAWWVGLPLLLAGVWSFAGFHLSPVSAKTASGSPYATGRLHALVIVPASSAPDRVVSTVASLPDNADVTLVGGPDAAYLAAEMGIACCTSEGLVPLMASWPPHDVVFPITAGVLVEAGALGRAIEGMGARGASWTSALPVFDDFDAYVPPAPRLASQWWLANAVRASSRVWVPSCTLAPAGVLAGAPRFRGWSDLLAAAPADSFGTQFEEAFSLVLPPYDAQEFFAQRMADTRTDLTTSTRAFVGGGAGLSSRVSAAALWLRTARGVPMLLAATIPALLALTGVVF
ncbi:MAG: hypothetical protein QG671_2099, partial [Actinomycetota bacterium]|nr:hypothetical protein [Actinomycetota bacterium]